MLKNYPLSNFVAHPCGDRKHALQTRANWRLQTRANGICGDRKHALQTRANWSGNEQNGFTTIIRTENIQREENEKYGIITEDTVRWLNDCRYKMIMGRVIKNDSKVDLTMDYKLEVEIFEVHEDYYKQKTTSMLTGRSMISEIKILK